MQSLYGGLSAFSLKDLSDWTSLASKRTEIPFGASDASSV